MATPEVRKSIVVFRGSPLDWPEYRHTVFWIKFQDGSSPATMMHISSIETGLFQFKVEPGYDPTRDARFAKEIDVGFITTVATSAEVEGALRRVTIDNEVREFNCQTWIRRVTEMLKEQCCLSAEDYKAGLEGMVDAIADAADGGDI